MHAASRSNERKRFVRRIEPRFADSSSKWFCVAALAGVELLHACICERSSDGDGPCAFVVVRSAPLSTAAHSGPHRVGLAT